MKLNHLILCTIFFYLPACTWVETTKEGSKVALVKSFNVNNCSKLGTTNVTVTHKIGILTREDEAVMQDLVIAAKNRAAEMGGDSIVAKEPVVDGKMSFDIFKCSQ
ncbi:MAG: DUF4156 domain-containing protein [Gammaproteobacteria bacterium]|nr:DUF4156 domain-containing protein [Gammaproteobacteria bacterium]